MGKASLKFVSKFWSSQRNICDLLLKYHTLSYVSSYTVSTKTNLRMQTYSVCMIAWQIRSAQY